MNQMCNDSFGFEAKVNVPWNLREGRVSAFFAATWLTALLMLLTLGTRTAHAQLDAATLNGTVTDATGAVIPDATVTITNAGTGVSRATVSNQAGDFSVPALDPGKYTVATSKAGFGTSEQSGVTLQVAQVATLNVVLKVGTAVESIDVSASTTALETTDASLGTVIPEKEVTDLPLNGRQFSQLLQLAPGTVPIDYSQNNGKAPNFGSGAASPGVDGQTNRSNLFFLDGIIASNPFFAGFSFSPSIDAIQEFKAQSHTDQAEYGQATGAVVSVVSRSGENSIHGAAYEFVRNTDFNAKNEFASSNLPYHLNQFGGSFGGPIKKDKLFYFANYEGGRQSISPSSNFSTVPSLNQRAGNFSGLLPGNVSNTIYDPATFNPVTFTESPFPGNQIPTARINTGMLALLNGIYPNPNQAANSGGLNNYTAPTKNTTTGDQGTIRVDYLIGQKDSMNGRFSINRAALSSPSSLANLFGTGFSGENTGASWTHVFSPTLLASITGGYNRLNIPQGIFTPVNQSALFTASGVGAGFNENPGDTTFAQVPGYSLQGGNYSGFWNGGGPIGPMNIVQVGGTVSKTEGKHTLKFGASYFHTWMYTNWNGNNMDFSFKGTWNAACQFAGTNPAALAQCPTYDAKAGNLGAGGDPVASMLLSAPIDATRNLGNSGVNLIETTPAIFAQDSWKVTPRLTVNYGLRWDYSAPMTEKNNRLATYNFYTSQYEVVKGDVDLPTGPLPANTAVLNRHSILTGHYADFSPRLGLAFQLNPKTTVRAGVGRTFDDWGLPLQVGQQNRGAWPSGLAQPASTQPLNTAGVSLKPDNTVVTGQNPFYGTAKIPASPLPAAGEGFQDLKWVPASSVQWNFEIERELGQIGSLSVAYVGSHTEHQTILQPFNTAPASTTPVAQQTNPYPDQIFGGVGSILRSTGWANYESLQAKLTRAFNNGLAYNAAFTYSQTLAFSSCQGDFSNECIQNLYNLSGDYGPSYLNVPLIFTLNANYALPLGKGRQYLNTGAASWILGDWQVNTILAIRSGLPINPTNGANNDTANSGNNTGNVQRVNYVGNPNSGAPHSKAEWFNPAAFALPANGTFGNAGINSLRGPGYWNDDLSLFKDIPITEKYRLQFRAEAFDVFNHPNLGQPDSGNNFNLGYAGSKTVNGVTTYPNGFNLITNTVASTGPGASRSLQLALKLVF
jgi:Carboxypeptidase regulatory-like domain/TonB dependent receptor